MLVQMALQRLTSCTLLDLKPRTVAYNIDRTNEYSPSQKLTMHLRCAPRCPPSSCQTKS